MDVSFEEENRYAPAQPVASQKGGVSGLVIRMGLAKDAKGAQSVLIVTVVICIAIIGFVWFFTGSEQAVSPEEYQQRAQMPQSAR